MERLESSQRRFRSADHPLATYISSQRHTRLSRQRSCHYCCIHNLVNNSPVSWANKKKLLAQLVVPLTAPRQQRQYDAPAFVATASQTARQALTRSQRWRRELPAPTTTSTSYRTTSQRLVESPSHEKPVESTAPFATHTSGGSKQPFEVDQAVPRTAGELESPAIANYCILDITISSSTSAGSRRLRRSQHLVACEC